MGWGVWENAEGGRPEWVWEWGLVQKTHLGLASFRGDVVCGLRPDSLGRLLLGFRIPNTLEIPGALRAPDPYGIAYTKSGNRELRKRNRQWKNATGHAIDDCSPG